MDKIVEKKMKDFIRLLHTINESTLPLDIDKRLNEDPNLSDKKIYDDTRYYGSICRMHCIHPNGKVKDEYQIIFNEEGFGIECNRRKTEGLNPFFIRTEKGLITF